MKVGFFGGSFDPIHFGHLNLILEILEKSDIDKILICPSNLAPNKIDNPHSALAKDRLEMVRLLVSDIEKVSICDLEVKREGISYTIDTLRVLKDSFSDISLIITNDALMDFHNWKEYNEILKITTPMVVIRSLNKKIPKEFKGLLKNQIKIRQLEISSSDIRDRLKKKLYCKHLTSERVLDFIFTNNLYLK